MRRNNAQRFSAGNSYTVYHGETFVVDKSGICIQKIIVLHTTNLICIAMHCKLILIVLFIKYLILPNYRTCSYKRTVKQLVVFRLQPVYFYLLLYKNICCWYSFELPRQVEAIQMNTNNIYFYKESQKNIAYRINPPIRQFVYKTGAVFWPFPGMILLLLNYKTG